MAIILTLILGGLAGWLASIVTKRNAQQGILVNIIVGIIGAFLANWLLAPLVGISATLSALSLGGFLMAVLGAIVLLVIINLFTRQSVR